VGDVPGVITYQEAGTQRIFAFVVGKDGHLYVNWWSGQQWAWADQGTPPNTPVASAPGVITYQEAGTQRIFAFVVGKDGHLYVNWWSGQQWAWADQGTPPPTPSVSIIGDTEIPVIDLDLNSDPTVSSSYTITPVSLQGPLTVVWSSGSRDVQITSPNASTTDITFDMTGHTKAPNRRTFTVDVSVTDANGNSASNSVSVTIRVSHERVTE